MIDGRCRINIPNWSREFLDLNFWPYYWPYLWPAITNAVLNFVSLQNVLTIRASIASKANRCNYQSTGTNYNIIVKSRLTYKFQKFNFPAIRACF